MIKKQDLLVLITVVIIASALSLIVANLLFKTERVKTQVEVVEPIDNSFVVPDKTYFNQNSLNPTKTIIINPDDNNDPFN